MTTNIKFFFRYIFIIVLLAVFPSTYAADKSQEVITVAIPKFGSGLVETWIKNIRKHIRSYSSGLWMGIRERPISNSFLKLLKATTRGTSPM